MDIWDKQRRSHCMANIHSKDTKPELIVRRYLHSRGYRFRKNVKKLPGTPDIVMRKYGVAIFVHGCFWHGHEPHMRLPKSNTAFWEAKIMRNRKRDETCKEALRLMGWSVITIWECQLSHNMRARTLAELERLINLNFLRRFRLPSERQISSYEPELPDTGNTPLAAEPEESYGLDS
ncbi:MAG: very short patch repair endonuclease [Duncaniella sp.]|nr:very short patch repair endonuclease [Duncaniella sp.]MDE7145833.1 very short patch repair endonuclease [Duncaniella sp.]